MTDQNMFIHLVAGGLAGTTGAILTCPLEVVKTRLQAGQNGYPSSSTSTCSNGLSNSKKLIALKTNNPLKSNQINHYHHNHNLQQLTFSNNTSSKLNNITPNTSKLNSYSNILFRNSHGGAATTTASHFITNEINFETQLNHSYNQTHHHNHLNHHHFNQVEYGVVKNQNSFRLGKNIVLSFKSIIENEGLRGLFKGLGPNLIGVAPYRAIYFFSYANSKTFLSKYMGEERPILHIFAAFIAGFSAVSITNPIWFVKTRLQLDQSRRGQTVKQVIQKILKEKGPLGFYKGISASYFGITESALYFVLYEKLKSLSVNRIPGESDEQLTLFTCFTSAGFSKTLASVLCYPHEVARTRLRQEGNKYTGFFQTLNLIIHEEGIRGIYKGMGTHLIRQIPNTAIVMTTYELIVHHFVSNDKSYSLANDDE